ncbi:hypothetical protein N9W89_12185 [Hellea sp.]|nr:hypothetical protein [Hellea sp.]
MNIELLAVTVAAIGGIISIAGETWNARKKRPTKTGLAALIIILIASTIAIVQVAASNAEEQRRKNLQAQLSYKALIGIYGPLSMWLDDFNIKGINEDSRDFVYPPNLNLDIYSAIQTNTVALEQFSEIISQGTTTPGGLYRNDRAEAFADRYRYIQNQIETTIVAYGPYLSIETLEHLDSLQSHSLFRDAQEYQVRGNYGKCKGWIDQLATDLAQESLEPIYRSRCKLMLKTMLIRALRDPVPSPKFAPGWEELHRKHCEQIGYKKPYCAFADVRSSAGLTIE